jgi:hypothetical protein
MWLRTSTQGLAFLVAFCLGSAMAEAGPVELGFDASIESQSPDDEDEDLVIVAIPTGTFSFQPGIRVGIFVHPRVSIEPALSLLSVHLDGESYTEFLGVLSVLAHFTEDQEATRVYLRGGIGMKLVDDESSQTVISGGLGLKIPAGERFAVRMEGSLAKAFEDESDGVPAMTILAARVGLSFFQ